MADRIDPSAPGPAHQLRQLAGGERREVAAVEFRKGRDDTGPGRHVDAQRQRLGGEDDLDQATLEELFDELLEVGEEAGMVHRQPAPERFPIEQIAIKLGFIGILDLLQASSERRIDLRFLGVGGQVETVDRATCQRLAAAASRKDEVDRRQEFAAPKTVDHGEQVVLRWPSQLGEPVVGRRLRLSSLARLTWDAALLVEQGIELVAHREPEPKFDWTLGHAYGGDVATLQAHPLRDFLEVADGRGEADELDVRRRLDDDLLPDGAAREVIDVVDFVEDDVADLLQPLRVLINKVAQDLRRHDDDWSAGVDGVLAGDEADVTLAMEPHVVAVFLVG